MSKQLSLRKIKKIQKKVALNHMKWTDSKEYLTYDKLVKRLIDHIKSSKEWYKGLAGKTAQSIYTEPTKEIDFPVPASIFDRDNNYRADYEFETDAFLYTLREVSVTHKLGCSFSTDMEILGIGVSGNKDGNSYMVGKFIYPVDISLKSLKSAIDEERPTALAKFKKIALKAGY